MSETPDWDEVFGAVRRALAVVGWLVALVVGASVRSAGGDLLGAALRGAAAWAGVSILGALGISYARSIVGAPRTQRRARSQKA